MNKDKLKSIISKKANGNNNLSAQLYQMYFFEHILDRLSKSQYKNNIILKGGLLLSSIIGDDERTTKDMDATLKSLPLERENVIQIVNDILNIDLDDGITFKIEDVKDIREESEYGGFKINILAMMLTLKVYLAIELTTGDKITPREIEYNYNCIFENKKIPILAYTLETVIAEKYETIIARDIYNTRMKDFYDIYYLARTFDFDGARLQMAIARTLERRGTPYEKDSFKRILTLAEDVDMQKRWKFFLKTIKDDTLEFSAVIEEIQTFLEPVFETIVNEDKWEKKWHYLGCGWKEVR